MQSFLFSFNSVRFKKHAAFEVPQALHSVSLRKLQTECNDKANFERVSSSKDHKPNLPAEKKRIEALAMEKV